MLEHFYCRKSRNSITNYQYDPCVCVCVCVYEAEGVPSIYDQSCQRLNCNNFHVDVRGNRKSITTAAGPCLKAQL
jgi:hypothetical protein